MLQDLIKVLSNQNLTFFENFVIWVNFFGALTATYFSAKAAKKGIPGQRRIFFLISGLASIFTVAYLYLLLSDISFLTWSSPLRGVSILAWFIVWISPAKSSIHLWEKLPGRIEKRFLDQEGSDVE